MKRNTGTWMAFLAMTFAVVGLVGLFGSYAAPIPLERAMARDATLDEVLATGDNKPALEALRDRLDDSAAVVIDGTAPLAERVATARAAMHTALLHESEASGKNLRLMIIVVTLVAALFGLIILGAVGRSP
ncbi:hypothetical protein [Acidisphaera sp. L21]|jgi:hypothetical protein|uniref:hypothetical protein n=1 Tax=Acidisphaera sp. L21 TaxID=1641851 RepID=UPI00131D8D73|nr:hypothetical protein [Acidisphaera sp. L21]